MVVTTYTKPKERQVIDHNESEGIELRNVSKTALGEGLIMPETSIAVCAKGEHVSGVPGSESMVGNRIVCVGTWESRIAPERSFQQAAKARRKYGNTAVGLTHSRGVGGVMPVESREPGALEGVSSRTQRDEEASAIH
jgi:hypothetical protein